MFKKMLSVICCILLIAAIALFTTGCNSDKTSEQQNSSAASQQEVTQLGKGETKFIFTVTDADLKQTTYEIHTDKKIVGDALLELGLIDGDEGEYGLYVKTVNGITVDYNTDGKYWAFYIDGEYASSGVDATDITDGATYSFKVE